MKDRWGDGGSAKAVKKAAASKLERRKEYEKELRSKRRKKHSSENHENKVPYNTSHGTHRSVINTETKSNTSHGDKSHVGRDPSNVPRTCIRTGARTGVRTGVRTGGYGGGTQGYSSTLRKPQPSSSKPSRSMRRHPSTDSIPDTSPLHSPRNSFRTTDSRRTLEEVRG